MTTDSFRARAWCFTLNTPTDDEIESLTRIATGDDDYIIYQRERGANGTVHIQGYIHFANARTFGRIKRMIPRAHIEVARGSPTKNKDYCSKTDTRIIGEHALLVERGTLPKPGARMDIDAILTAVKEGVKDEALWNEYPSTMLRYHKSIAAFRLTISKHRTFQTKIITIWGVTGAGKSHEADRLLKEVEDDYGVLICQEGKSMWADGAADHDAVLIEDFEGNIYYRAMLAMLDKWRCTMPVKGGSTKWAPKLIVITSNLAPKFWYSQDAEWDVKSPIKRRLTENGNKVIHMAYKYIAPPVTGVEAMEAVAKDFTLNDANTPAPDAQPFPNLWVDSSDDESDAEVVLG